jgi:hypothetical protein
MYELDNAKDQVMTVCKVALANLVMWTREMYFPSDYEPTPYCPLQEPTRRSDRD